MKPIRSLTASVAVLAIAACVPQPKSSPPVQKRPSPAPTVTTPPPAPIYNSWMDAPQTPGDWSYRAASGGGTALFGERDGGTRFTMRCDASARTVILSRAGLAQGTPRMMVRTESQTRTLAASMGNSTQSVIEARLPASDRLLDAMALSKGRFAIEMPGSPTLYLPSWAEVTRVIEDCR